MNKFFRSGCVSESELHPLTRDTRYVESMPGRTVQAEKDQADINVILRNFGVTGALPQKVALPTYGDFDAVADYQSALNLIRIADQGFMTLPASTRSRFGNNPADLLTFLADPANKDEAVKLGLVEAPKELAPVPGAPPVSTVAT